MQPKPASHTLEWRRTGNGRDRLDRPPPSHAAFGMSGSQSMWPGGRRARRGEARTIDEEMATKKRIQNGGEEMTAEIRRLKGGDC